MANITNLQPMQKGERRCGRKAGVLNRTTRLLKLAIITAAEKSKHSDGSLESYCLFLADEKPETFAQLLARLIPVQAKVEATENVRVRLERLTPTMALSEMISAFEKKLKSSYCPPLPRIEHDDDDDDDDALNHDR
jgi:hypothetical protein